MSRRSEYQRRRREAHKRIWSDIKVAFGCALCGYNRSSRALHWHHIDPASKHQKISTLLQDSSFRKAAEEISHCVLVCANCHAEIETSFSSKVRG